MTDFDRHALGSLQHHHGSMRREQLDHQRIMVRFEMLDHHQRAALVAGEGIQKPLTSIKPTCGSADADHRPGGF